MRHLAAIALCLLVACPAAAYRSTGPTATFPKAPLNDWPDPAAADEEEWLADPHSSDSDTTAVPPVSGLPASAIRYGDFDLPPAVAATRDALMEAARSGDIEALRPLFEGQRAAPMVTPGGAVEDAVNHLRLQSGDDEGQEILAILLEILEAGYVVDGEGAAASYIWPFYALVPLKALSAAQRVDVYRLLTSIDVEEMEMLGRYTFFRVGIAADGRLRYFAAGDWE